LLASATPPAPSLPVATARGTSSGAAPVAPEASATSTQDAKDAELAAERALVDRARSALGRGDTTASLDAVAAHEARFPRGRLTEERELVAIQALVRRGETGAAKARADRFRRAHPKSVFVPAIDRLAPP
jgi:outer membrane protein assembly factor BamD (BamD/ComL family)